MAISRTIAISDIHGCNQQLHELLDKAAYDPAADRLLLLGDYVDRGPDSWAVIESILSLLRQGGASVQALRGNHDQRFLQCLRQPAPELLLKFLGQGGHETLASYARAGGYRYRSSLEDASSMLDIIATQFAAHEQFLDGLGLYVEDDRYIYVHAGLDPAAGLHWKEQPRELFMWIREPFYNAPVSAGKTVVFGHTRTMKFHDGTTVWFGGDKIGIDGGCCSGGRLNALVIDGDGICSELSVPASPISSSA